MTTEQKNHPFKIKKAELFSAYENITRYKEQSVNLYNAYLSKPQYCINESETIAWCNR